MTRPAFNSRSGRRRVPFFPDTSHNSGSVHQIYNQISLPENGTIFRPFPPPRKSVFGVRSKRAAFCALKKASMTVEAAIAVPLFLMAVVSIISMINVYGTALERAASLRDTAMTTALIAGIGEDETIIDLRIPYSFRLFFLKDITIPCRAYVRAWNGRDEASASEGKGSYSEFVYVTDNMSVYHTSSQCSHLDLSIRAVPAASVSSLRNKSGGIYHSCEKCGAGSSDGLVYVTSYGEFYHTDPDCSSLKRSVRLVERSEIDGSLCQCSRCAALAG